MRRPLDEHEDPLDGAIREVARLEIKGKLDDALRRLEELLAEYPETGDEEVLLGRIRLLKWRARFLLEAKEEGAAQAAAEDAWRLYEPLGPNEDSALSSLFCIAETYLPSDPVVAGKWIAEMFRVALLHGRMEILAVFMMQLRASTESAQTYCEVMESCFEELSRGQPRSSARNRKAKKKV